MTKKKKYQRKTSAKALVLYVLRISYTMRRCILEVINVIDQCDNLKMCSLLRYKHKRRYLNLTVYLRERRFS